jgi:hypothetical protein
MAPSSSRDRRESQLGRPPTGPSGAVPVAPQDPSLRSSVSLRSRISERETPSSINRAESLRHEEDLHRKRTASGMNHFQYDGPVTNFVYVQIAKKTLIPVDRVRIQVQALRRDRVRILARVTVAAPVPVTSRVNMQSPESYCQLIIQEVREVSANRFICSMSLLQHDD